MLEEVNIPYALPLIVWRERCDWNRRYILDMMFTNDRSRSFNRYASLLALKFSRGKFTSYHIHLDAEVEVMEFNDMEERFWFFDGVMVRQSSPCPLLNKHQ
ncbi:hypothetical protein QYF36_018903 [Acer negundo]|nr:hypothetical protein QYF36_018903 [Acer negundo]